MRVVIPIIILTCSTIRPTTAESHKVSLAPVRLMWLAASGYEPWQHLHKNDYSLLAACRFRLVQQTLYKFEHSESRGDVEHRNEIAVWHP